MSVGSLGRRAVLWAVREKIWCHGPKPRDAQFMASSQQGEPFRAWLESSRVSESFHARPGASGDGPRYVVGVAPRGHWRAPRAMPHGARVDLPPCGMARGEPRVTGDAGTPHSSYDAVPADAHSLGTWHPARGEFNLPRVGVVPGAW